MNFQHQLPQGRVPCGSVVKCLTRNSGVLGSSLTGSSGFFRGSVLGQDTSEPSLVLVNPGKRELFELSPWYDWNTVKSVENTIQSINQSINQSPGEKKMNKEVESAIISTPLCKRKRGTQNVLLKMWMIWIFFILWLLKLLFEIWCRDLSSLHMST